MSDPNGSVGAGERLSRLPRRRSRGVETRREAASLGRTARGDFAEETSILHRPGVLFKAQESYPVEEAPVIQGLGSLPHHGPLSRDKPLGKLQPTANPGPGCAR